MSFYSDSNVKTRYLDPKIYVPAVNGGGRATFELDASEAAYLPNMRLTNLGVTAAAKTDYNKQLGALALIRNIRLLDGKVVLSQVNDFRFHRIQLRHHCHASRRRQERVGQSRAHSTRRRAHHLHILSHVHVRLDDHHHNPPKAMMIQQQQRVVRIRFW